MLLSPILDLLTELLALGEFLDITVESCQLLSSNVHLLVVNVDIGKSGWLVMWVALDFSNDLSDLSVQLISLWSELLVNLIFKVTNIGILFINEVLDGLSHILVELIMVLLDVLELLDDILLIGKFNLTPSITVGDLDMINSVLDSCLLLLVESCCLFFQFLSLMDKLLDGLTGVLVVGFIDLFSGLHVTLSGVYSLLNIIFDFLLSNLLSWAHHLNSLWLVLDVSWSLGSSDDLSDVTGNIGDAWLESMDELLLLGVSKLSAIVGKINPVIDVL